MDFVLKICLYVILIAMSWEDIRKKEVSNRKTLAFILCSFLLASFQKIPLQNIVISMAMFPFPLIFVYGYLSDYLGKEVLGFGDIKALMGFGIALSHLELWQSLYFFYVFSFALASFVGLYLFFRTRSKELPMLPFFSLSYVLLGILL